MVRFLASSGLDKEPTSTVASLMLYVDSAAIQEDESETDTLTIDLGKRKSHKKTVSQPPMKFALQVLHG